MNLTNGKLTRGTDGGNLPATASLDLSRFLMQEMGISVEGMAVEKGAITFQVSTSQTVAALLRKVRGKADIRIHSVGQGRAYRISIIPTNNQK